MIAIRKAKERGHADHGWLDTYHTFSFDSYFDPEHMGFRQLRVINEDRVQAAKGFPTHPHRDMEIVTYILEGALEHRDSMGNGSVIRPGEVQRMTAGTGVTHSEYNPSQTDAVHLLQIWILPQQRGLKPSYEQKSYSDEEKKGHFRLIVSRDGREGSMTIHQDSEVYATLLDRDQEVTFDLHPERYAWIQVARGAITINGHPLGQGDGAAISEEEQLKIVGTQPAELLIFDLA